MGDIFLIPFVFDDLPIDGVMLEDGKTFGFTTHHLANVFETTESYINQIVQRNDELFDESTFDCKMQSNGRMKTFKCLTRDGVVILISLLNYKGYEPEKRERIISFRKWSAKVTVEVMTGEVSNELVTWLAERKLAKMLYKTLTDAVKEKYITEMASEKEKRMIYGREANIINIVVFGTKANGVNRRDTATAEQLKCLNKCQGVLPGLVMGDVPYDRRLEILQEVVDKLVLESNDRERLTSI